LTAVVESSSSSRRVARRPAEAVAQHEHGALLGWEQLHCGDVGEADPFARDRPRLRRGLGRGELVEEAVGVGLQVCVDRAGRAVALFQHPQRDVGRDAVQLGGGEQRVVRGRHAGTGHGPPSSVHGDGVWTPDDAADCDEADALRPGQDLPALLGRHAHHHTGAQLEALAVRDQCRRAGQRDVDLLLALVLRSSRAWSALHVVQSGRRPKLIGAR
jgi:hypothetical protein